MKQEKRKWLGEERRELILKLLKNSSTPITGNELAKKAQVSRQVIVGDINLLKARNEPIIATSQGYLYMKSTIANEVVEKTIVCFHDRSQTEKELNIIVDHGVIVKNVIVEHPVYGEITASLMLANRKDVSDFVSRIENTNAALLTDLTSGIHLHTLMAPNIEAIEQVEAELKKEGILVDDTKN